MPKVAVLISSYNCNEALPNTFTSISRQKVNFDYEVCYLDDCSYNDPKPIYEKYLQVPHKKGLRLKQHIGTYLDPRSFPDMPWLQNSFAMLFDMLSPDVEIILMNHGDMIMAYDNMFQKMVDKVKSKTAIYPNAYTISVPKNLYELDWKQEIKKIIAKIPISAYYQGARRLGKIDAAGGMAPTLACFLKEDLYELEYNINSSEFNIGANLNKFNYTVEEPKDDNLLAIFCMFSLL